MLKALLATAVLAAALSGCVAYPVGPEVEVAPVYAVGFYEPAYGYWTGYGWDVNYYAYGHRGYGHARYHGPRYVRGGYYRHH